MRWIRIATIALTLMLGSFTPATAAGPDITVRAPQEGAIIDASSVTVDVTASGITLVPTSVPVTEAGKRPEANRPGEGHLHFVLDLQPLVIWDRAASYTFADVQPGEHILMVELVNNDHSALSPPVMRQIRFRTTMTGRLPATGAAETPVDSGAGMLALIAVGIALYVVGLALCMAPRLIATRREEKE
jgi:hypothetical protein